MEKRTKQILKEATIKLVYKHRMVMEIRENNLLVKGVHRFYFNGLESLLCMKKLKGIEGERGRFNGDS